MLPGMSTHTDDDQRRDALLTKLLQTPPEPRPKRERGEEKATRTRASRASGEKPEASA